ncbi:MAG: dTDP-4-dehydrorhamnose reductase [Steroidobacteraceae bacterium]|jgi:dTDP-4-dehydrorhamnose reductase
MKVLVLGAGGQVARAVVRAMSGPHEVFVRTHAEVDIANAESLDRTLAEAKADWIVNGAAYTAVDLAEDEPALAAAINDAAVGTVAAAARRARARLLHLSTDFVFDGAANRAYLPSDPPNPLSVYGATKLAGEKKALDAECAAIVLRTAWVYAAAGRNFVLTMLRLMREREQVRVVGDQIGTPTWTGGIAHAIRDLLEVDAPAGIYHWTDLGVASWYDFAVAIQDEALERGLLSRAVSIVPIATSEYPTRARRPAFSVLDSKATRDLVAAPAMHWRHNLRMMLDELRAA